MKNDLPTLADIYKRYDEVCDKGTAHSYIPVYEKILAPYRDKPVTFVEIGIGGGDCLAMWCRYFTHPDTIIVGVDIANIGPILHNKTNDRRLQFVHGDATLPNTASRIPTPDIVIDDASHDPVGQATTFELLWPRVKPGGLYVVEDVAGDGPLRKSHDFTWLDLRGVKGRYDDLMAVANK